MTDAIEVCGKCWDKFVYTRLDKDRKCFIHD